MRKLTAPIAPPPEELVSIQSIPRLIVEVCHESTEGALVINNDKTAITYEVAGFATDGTPKGARQRVVFHKDWSPAVTKAVQTIFDFCDTKAEGEGLVGAGKKEKVV